MRTAEGIIEELENIFINNDEYILELLAELKEIIHETPKAEGKE